ncbi:uncharacterized protein DEA37_0003163 [Paragonimus westermani]|uniref:Reverse transcriptase domain-containing protein n=1 Tax=Paragonimus westermani TaxID=34504 RepID=A0A5J4NX16_9TREM|nr:uncharacterized protein DEA37_0003163 [Paragonimus westermani]
MLTPQQLRYISKQIKSSPTAFVDRVFPKSPSSLCDSADTNATVDIHGCISDFCPRSPVQHTPSVSPTVQRDEDDKQPDEDSHLSDTTEEESLGTNDELETQLSSLVDCYFLQLVPVKKRRMILRKADINVVSDSVALCVLQNCPLHNGFHVSLSRSLYAHSASRVTVYGELSQMFVTSSGVRRACPISPFLFNFVMVDILELVVEESIELGVELLPGARLTDLEYSIDTVLLSLSAKDM